MNTKVSLWGKFRARVEKERSIVELILTAAIAWATAQSCVVSGTLRDLQEFPSVVLDRIEEPRIGADGRVHFGIIFRNEGQGPAKRIKFKTSELVGGEATKSYQLDDPQTARKGVLESEPAPDTLLPKEEFVMARSADPATFEAVRKGELAWELTIDVSYESHSGRRLGYLKRYAWFAKYGRFVTMEVVDRGY